MASKPAIVLSPGSFSKVSLYAHFVYQLHQAGYDRIEVVRLPSLGKRDPLPAATMEDDANEIRKVIEQVSNDGFDVLLMAHSYGGIPATESVKGVTKKERAAQGKPGGVVRILYTTAVVPDLGGDLASVMGDGIPSSIRIDGEYMTHVDVGPLIETCFNDMPYEEALPWAKRFGQHSAISFGGKLTYQGYKDVPVSYMFCENDKCVLPRMQQAGIDFVEKASGRKVDVYRYNVDHIPYFGKIDCVVDAVNRAASEQN
ncbi:hypothetical protein, variant [Verruconis gallopava]|uniref:AB hydrolase-1 domain-containing protein n=1 Tax=Verruconis gallopava TaxID=253628 RepID=A0A0D2A724_9PEZI|nr:uncharacterized protein PV09_06308 [Verruconis gallopava]XP_016212378.1 hypothetical protein, variant [Verruconis gallopava]KIW02508.1 hypothetical protein PV09_06308 [Verruconis gallopava]KIW02509.1 hypothetical protein, variant [Verruconis gallopava]